MRTTPTMIVVSMLEPALPSLVPRLDYLRTEVARFLRFAIVLAIADRRSRAISERRQCNGTLRCQDAMENR